ncbi:hybrid signal transduction histidine kinase M [Tanacetum coccineum]
MSRAWERDKACELIGAVEIDADKSASEGALEMPKLHVTPEPEKSGKNVKFNLRKSLPWDSAFFTSDGKEETLPRRRNVQSLSLMNSTTKQAQLVVEDPQTAREAWDHLKKIVHDNKRTRSIALKAKLRSLKLGDLTIDAYFQKIESIDIMLTSLGLPISNDDIVTIALKGFLNKYVNASEIIAHREPFSDLKMARSMLTTQEMRLKSRAQATSIDSSFSSSMVLLANSGNNYARRSPSASGKINKPCVNFARGFYRFGDSCRYRHEGTNTGVNINTSLWSTSTTHHTSSLPSSNMTVEQMIALIQRQQALLNQFGVYWD